jgi:phosphoglycolate phosphatase-like HAD superfamily hydrolase
MDKLRDKLVLFDIDGTLVRGARCHYQAFVEAVGRYYGVKEDISTINYAGKTDPQILMEVLELGGLGEEEVRPNFEECLDFMTRYYLKNVHRESIKVLGGVRELLEELQNREVLLGLVTGNLEPIAYAKLERVGLDGYFPFGGFGSDHYQRPFLVKKALERARNGFNYHGRRVFVVGDTPRDVDAGKASQTLTVGVSTGRYSQRELQDSGADFVLENLKDTGKLLKIFEIPL